MASFALNPAERRLLTALAQRGVPFILVGMGAALLEGAPVATQDIDLWFSDASDPRIALAAADAGGFWISGFGMQPPGFGGTELERIDVVLTVHGLDSFAEEFSRALEVAVDDLRVRILPLERVLASKLFLRRAKDLAQIPALEATLLARQTPSQK
ncbi:MAG: hypothetical protein ABSB49_00100 [Polyangia bacterium]